MEAEEIKFSWLERQCHIRIGKRQVEAIAMVTPAVPPGLAFTTGPAENPNNRLNFSSRRADIIVRFGIGCAEAVVRIHP